MKIKVLRVAQVIGKANAGGVESCIMNYYRNIDKTKIQFDFLVENTCKIIDREKIESMGGKVIIIPPYTKIFKYIKELKKIFKEGNYDIVHSNMNTLSVFTLFAAWLAKVKIRIAHSHSTTNKKEWKKNIVKNILRPFSKLFATDYFACSELAGRWLFGNRTFNEGKVTIINNAIEVERFLYSEEVRKQMRKELNVEDKFVIGHIGRFVEQKNHSYLIDIFYEVQKERPNSILLLVGNGPLYEEIYKKVEKLGISEKVIFAGVHKHPEKYYQAMDVFVLPSLYEGLPVVGVEAQANLLPCFFADTITKEILINENVEMIGLENIFKWVNAILMKDLRVRKENVNKIIDSKYDIKNEVKKMYKKF